MEGKGLEWKTQVKTMDTTGTLRKGAGEKIILLFWVFGALRQSQFYMSLDGRGRKSFYFNRISLESERLAYTFVWEGEEFVSCFAVLGLESGSFSLFPHSFEWVSQQPHLSSPDKVN